MRILVPRVVWFALLCVPFVYGAIASQTEVADLSIGLGVWVTIIVQAAFWVTLSFVVPHHLLKHRLSGKSFAVSASTGGSPSVFTNPERVKKETRAAWGLPFFISILCSVGPAIEGFILGFFMKAAPVIWLPFLTLSAILVAVRFPTEPRILAKAEAVYQSRMPSLSAAPE